MGKATGLRKKSLHLGGDVDTAALPSSFDKVELCSVVPIQLPHATLRPGVTAEKDVVDKGTIFFNLTGQPVGDRDTFG